MSIDNISARDGFVIFSNRDDVGGSVGVRLSAENIGQLAAALEANEPATERRREIIEGLAARFPWITDDEVDGVDALKGLAAWIQEGFTKRPTIYACDLCGKWHQVGVEPTCKTGLVDPDPMSDSEARALWAMTGKRLAAIHHTGYQHMYQKGVCIFKDCKHTQDPQAGLLTQQLVAPQRLPDWELIDKPHCFEPVAQMHGAPDLCRICDEIKDYSLHA
jgi:hypothetical protein